MVLHEIVFTVVSLNSRLIKLSLYETRFNKKIFFVNQILIVFNKQLQFTNIYFIRLEMIKLFIEKVINSNYYGELIKTF